MRKAVIFDLDGTLTRSEEGIWNCVRHAVRCMGVAEPDAQTLRKFVGPPLRYSFQTYMGMTEDEAHRAVTAYRERYTTVGLFENRVYPGIRRLLRMLHRAGWYVAIATGKPQDTSQRIIEHFGLSPYFAKVVGPNGVTSRSEKDWLIRQALPDEWDEAWMVGDRCFDIEGGRAVGIHTIGVGYGYGSEEELRHAGCDAYAATVEDLIACLCPDVPVPEGFFLSMEGLDGSGKTTQLSLLTDVLDRWGFEVEHTREPGGDRVAEEIRRVILDRDNVGMTALTEALLYAAARAQHVRTVIRPAMAAGQLVLSDRYVDSSVAYQGGGRQLGVETVLALNEQAVDGTWPLATVYLELPYQEGLKRRRAAAELDRIEMENHSFHARVEDGYHAMIARHPDRFIVVDASRTAEEIGAEIAEEVIRRLLEEEKHG